MDRKGKNDGLVEDGYSNAMIIWISLLGYENVNKVRILVEYYMVYIVLVKLSKV